MEDNFKALKLCGSPANRAGIVGFAPGVEPLVHHGLPTAAQRALLALGIFGSFTIGVHTPVAFGRTNQPAVTNLTALH